MRLNISKVEQKLKDGIYLIEKYGFMTTCDDGIIVQAQKGNENIIEKKGDEVSIIYDTLPHFYMLLGRIAGVKDGIQKIEPKIEKFGIMWDCSRNAVPKPDMVKKQICSMILAGYNYLCLYTEETYELPSEPYFGYKRGRYTQEELKEIIEFADIFEMEMVPCIQTLAHLKNLANWKPYFDHMDIDDILLVGDERTYKLIRKMLTYCKETFHTERINIGSDEAFHLGRGTYIEKNGYCSKHEIYLEHMKKVFEICKEVGLKPEFWADAFYDTDRSDEEIKSVFDGNETPIYWEYAIPHKEPHIEKINKLQKYAGEAIYAGGLWEWIGYAPDNKYTDMVVDAAFEAVEECHVKNVVMTAWGDNGGECSIFAVLPSMWYAANKLYPMELDMDKIMLDFTGYSDKEWRKCDELNKVSKRDVKETKKITNAVKYLLANDYMVGLLDANIPDDAGIYFTQLHKEFEKLAERESEFSYIFKAYRDMCLVLIHKATFSKRLYKAYQNSDKEKIKQMIDELKQIQSDAHKLCDSYRILWMTENKGFGYEVVDLRLGGALIARADTVIHILNEYVQDEIDIIYELEEERIEYFCGQLKGDEIYKPFHNMWSTAYTVNHV